MAPLRRSPRLLAALLAAYAAAWLAISQLPLAPALLAVALSEAGLGERPEREHEAPVEREDDKEHDDELHGVPWEPGIALITCLTT